MIRFDFRGCIALVTGVDSGIGRVVSLGLAAEGAIVSCADICKEAEN